MGATLDSERFPWPDGIGMIYLGMSPWDGMWRNRHQLMSRFANAMPVLYVEPPQQLRPLLRRVLARQISWNHFRPPDLRRIESGLHVLGSSAFYPVSGSALLRRLTRTRWCLGVCRAARTIGIDKPILWVSLPEQVDAVGRLGEILSVYHVVDEYSGYTGQDRDDIRKGAAAEKLVLDSVDLTIAVSPELVRSKSATNREICLVENAVNLREFMHARSRDDIPCDLAALPEPRLGYSGLIGKRLNLSLVLELARRRPEWSIVFVGKIDGRECGAELLALQKMTNVHFLGEKTPDEVARYVTGLHVGLLPYELNTETMHISPLKMYEYLAAGLPVVSTAVPSAIRHEALVAVAGNIDEFEQRCRIALNENRPEYVEARVEFAGHNTWEHRIAQLTEILSARLRKKGYGCETI